MNNLILNNTDKREITMTSLEVVELINNFREEEGNRKELQHKTFMASIRNEIETLENADIRPEQYFLPGSYIDKQNQERPCFKMKKAGIMQNKKIVYL
ncbi:phage antirepressor protein [[Clostridium] sordellii]|uniref:hypothetical protein n=1 Tax=Paraclostridium sordellii TaxID=1505 RepID=UPI000543E0FB|nr:hypothetical protein [Paeniclostridium sordellii]CEK33594.1 phage antirepressor protein [[Clostridium] sordellii] [Paeniclostridium sordellii]